MRRFEPCTVVPRICGGEVWGVLPGRSRGFLPRAVPRLLLPALRAGVTPCTVARLGWLSLQRHWEVFSGELFVRCTCGLKLRTGRPYHPEALGTGGQSTTMAMFSSPRRLSPWLPSLGPPFKDRCSLEHCRPPPHCPRWLSRPRAANSSVPPARAGPEVALFRLGASNLHNRCSHLIPAQEVSSREIFALGHIRQRHRVLSRQA